MEELKQLGVNTVAEVKDSPGFKRFKKAVTESDELVTMVLRTHLLSEYYIDQIIHAKLPRGDIVVDDNRTTYSYKLKILKALEVFSGEQTSYLDSVAGLNTVRNNCSHALDYKISEDDVDKIGKSFGRRYLKLKLECGDDIKKLLMRTLMMLCAGLDGICEAIVNN